MSDTAAGDAIEAYGDMLGVELDGDAIMDSAFDHLEREGVVERVDSGESGKDTDTEGGT